MITSLADDFMVATPEPFADGNHPMRKITRAVAFDGQGAWHRERARRVAELFDSMAAGWAAERTSEARSRPLVDALRRGSLNRAGCWLELGSGAGAGATTVVPELAVDQGGWLTSMDLSSEMLAHDPNPVPLTQADASALPVRDGAVDVVLLINMMLFPQEVSRALTPHGQVLWVNTLGDQTPIHLPPADVVAALDQVDGPGAWSATTARSGTGFWVVAQRQTEA